MLKMKKKIVLLFFELLLHPLYVLDTCTFDLQHSNGRHYNNQKINGHVDAHLTSISVCVQ